MLTRETAAGVIKPNQYRVIYTSESFPTAGLGYVYNLKPELAKKVPTTSLDQLSTPNWGVIFANYGTLVDQDGLVAVIRDQLDSREQSGQDSR